LQLAPPRRRAKAYIKLKKGDWSKANASTWRGSGTNHNNPVIGTLNVANIETGDVKRVLDTVLN
jgi:hypothetical protein